MIGQQGEVDDAGYPVSQEEGENTGSTLETIFWQNLQQQNHTNQLIHPHIPTSGLRRLH